jgi:hypothetical protein
MFHMPTVQNLVHEFLAQPEARSLQVPADAASDGSAASLSLYYQSEYVAL